MARIINKFKYRNKFFLAGELLVGDYMISIKDPEYFLEKILSEFNDKPPKLNKLETEEFIKILFAKDDTLDIFRASRRNKKQNSDFHILLGMFMKATGNGYRDIIEMPLELFQKMVDDLEIISGQKEYDPNRNSRSPDRKKIKELFGDKKDIKA